MCMHGLIQRRAFCTLVLSLNDQLFYGTHITDRVRVIMSEEGDIDVESAEDVPDIAVEATATTVEDRSGLYSPSVSSVFDLFTVSIQIVVAATINFSLARGRLLPFACVTISGNNTSIIMNT